MVVEIDPRLRDGSKDVNVERENISSKIKKIISVVHKWDKLKQRDHIFFKFQKALKSEFEKAKKVHGTFC